MKIRKGVQVYTVRDFIKTPEGYESSLKRSAKSAMTACRLLDTT